MSILSRHIINVPRERDEEIIKMLHLAGVITEEQPDPPRTVAIHHPGGLVILADRGEAHWRRNRINEHLAAREIEPAVTVPEYPNPEWADQVMDLAILEFQWEDDRVLEVEFQGGQKEWTERILAEYPEAFRAYGKSY